MLRFILSASILLASVSFLRAQDSLYTLKVMQYNLLNFGVATGSCTFDNAKYGYLEEILTHYQPHIFAVNEIGLSTLYPTNILNLCFTYTNLMERTTITNIAQGDRVNHLFYDRSLFELASEQVIPTSSLRDINLYSLYFKPALQNGDTVLLHCVVAHLKAGSTNGDRNQREQATAQTMTWLNANLTGENVLFLGDFNIGAPSEQAFQNLIAPSSGTFEFEDPISTTNSWSGASFAGVHTQSTRQSSTSCFAGGGMDDRFDLILSTQEVLDGSKGVRYKEGSYKALGNHGGSYNTDLICGPPNNTVPATVCLALRDMSDHLPVVMEVEISGAKATNITSLAPVVQLRPSPFQASMSVYAPEHKGLNLSIMDAAGREMISLSLSKGIEQTEISTHTWPRGVYLVKATDEAGRSFVQKVLKY